MHNKRAGGRKRKSFLIDQFVRKKFEQHKFLSIRNMSVGQQFVWKVAGRICLNAVKCLPFSVSVTLAMFNLIAHFLVSASCKTFKSVQLRAFKLGLLTDFSHTQQTNTHAHTVWRSNIEILIGKAYRIANTHTCSHEQKDVFIHQKEKKKYAWGRKEKTNM